VVESCPFYKYISNCKKRSVCWREDYRGEADKRGISQAEERVNLSRDHLRTGINTPDGLWQLPDNFFADQWCNSVSQIALPVL